MKIRLASIRDAPRIATMSRHYIEYGLGWAWTPSRLVHAIRKPDNNVIVTEVEESVVGFAVMYYGENEARLNLFAVDPEFRRQGIGTRMIEWLEETARVNGSGTIYLEVRLTNRIARAFYKALGYREVRELRGYYQGRESAVRMARELWSAVPPG